jgi:hypothetical protein
MIMQNFSDIANRLKDNGYSLVGTGTKRAAYVSPCKKHVIKVPIDPIGIMENFHEHMRYKKGDRSKLAKCMLTPNSLIIMEYIQIVPNYLLPEWCEEFDNQVGLNKKGVLVAYDYGC